MSTGDGAATAGSLELPGPFRLDSGERLPSVTVAYRTWGRLDGDGGNGVLVCHALTGSPDVDRWWGALLGEGRALDPRRDFVVCSNVLGSCYGTTGPATRRPGSSVRWGPDFPEITVRDMVRVQALLLDALGVRRLRLVLGGSLGGMQVLEWALLRPDRVDAIVPIAVSARHSAWCIGISEAQRQAIYADPRWRDGRYPEDDPPSAGLAAARAVAMLTYRSRESLETRFSRAQNDGVYSVESWLHHHGRALVDRFDANTYVTLTRAMDTHDVGRGRGGWREALASLQTPTLVVTIDSDLLYPPVEQEELAAALPLGRLERLRSPHGHDAFLIEGEAVNALVARFRKELGTARAREEAPLAC
jgi:homoserine O-acetyltransferase